MTEKGYFSLWYYFHFLKIYNIITEFNFSHSSLFLNSVVKEVLDKPLTMPIVLDWFWTFGHKRDACACDKREYMSRMVASHRLTKKLTNVMPHVTA